MQQNQQPERIGLQPGPQEQFGSSLADIAIYGGSAGGGKTIALLFEPLKWIDVPNFGCVIFRRDSTQITKEGGLWDTSERFYPQAGGSPSQHNLKWTFPIHFEGNRDKAVIGYSTISFAHLQLERDKFTWQGTQIPLLCFDELNHFTESQFFYMLTRNRSSTGIPGYVRATCNPDTDSWVAKFIAWWIDQDTGYPTSERAGVLRWFIRVKDELVWADTKEELTQQYGTQQMPKSVTFIPAKITDNQILMREDPAYLSNLMAQPTVDRARLLDGNWKIRASAGMCFKRHWFEVKPFSAVPMSGRTIRYWDRAATVPSPQNPDPDWTVGLKVRHINGIFYILHCERFRDRPHGVKQRIKDVAASDGPQVEIVLEGDPGSAGDFEISEYITWLAGYTVRTNKPTKAKYERAKPAMTQAEGRKIVLVGDGDHPAQWHDAFLAELENFGEDPKQYSHDDQCLAAGTKVLTATGWRIIETIAVGDLVMTRDGLKPVEWAGNTGVADTMILETEADSIEATGNHPVLTDRGFVRLDTITGSHRVIAWQQLKLSKKHQRGTAANLVVNGIQKTENECGKTGNLETLFASNVEPASNPKIVEKSNIVQIAVVTVRDGRKNVPVYNLRVKDKPEFVANGILVHNCDTLSGSVQVLTQPAVGFTTDAGIRAGKQTPFSIDRLTPADLGL